MKVGDNIPVYIAGQVVANAKVRELGNDTATLVVPATLVVMAVRTELAGDAPAADTTGTETIITGVDRSTGAPVENQTTTEPVANNDTTEVSVAVPSNEPVVENVEPPVVLESTNEQATD